MNCKTDPNHRQLLPFHFKSFDEEHYLLTNPGGEYYFLKKANFKNLIDGSSMPEETVNDLVSQNFLSYKDLTLSLEMLATKYRTRTAFLRNFTTLHMMVVTLRCNHQCTYCQVRSQSGASKQYDMSSETAVQTLKHIFSSPARDIKIEFQGGEPLLNWTTIVATVLEAKKMNQEVKKNLSFVICTNLTLIEESHLEFLKEHGVMLSTSLDGPKDIHDTNRVMCGGKSSYDVFTKKLALARKFLGLDGVSALLTITKSNIDRLPEVIDEYCKNGFIGIFLRSLNPYGMAVVNSSQVGYEMGDFVRAYEVALDYIIDLNLRGHRFVEYYTALLLRRILTSFPTGFVDLQSPAGAAISGVIYDYNGDVYPADEGRMLARMGDKRFLMGNVFSNTYLEMFKGPVAEEVVKNSCLATLPRCSSCVFQTFCGADPIRNYAESKDLMGGRGCSEFCKKHQGIFTILFRKLLERDPNVMGVFWSWLTPSEN